MRFTTLDPNNMLANDNDWPDVDVDEYQLNDVNKTTTSTSMTPTGRGLDNV